LILVRLLATGKPPVKSDFDKALKRYLPAQQGAGQGGWSEQLGQTLAGLERDGLIEAKPYRLTDAGREQAARFLGLMAPPANAKWPTLRDRYLVARALGIDPADKELLKKVGSSDGVRAAVLVRHFQLPGSPVPSESRVMHLLAWRQLREAHDLEIPLTQDISHKAILGATLLKGQHAKEPVKLLAAQVTRADNTDIAKVRDAVIRQWLAAREAVEPPPPSVSPSLPSSPAASSVSPSPPFDLTTFAARVQELARSAATGRFGDNKVFLSHVWDRFIDQPQDASDRNGHGPSPGMTRAEFDRHLVEANRQNLLTLSRADLVSAMDPGDVEASEIRLPHSTFHFVRTDR
jgi:hypothetical protein